MINIWQPSLPDIFAFTWLNRFITAWIPSPPEAITEAKFPHIWALWKGVRDSKGIKEYFDSGRWNLA
jgi:glutathione S-transferase